MIRALALLLAGCAAAFVVGFGAGYALGMVAG